VEYDKVRHDINEYRMQCAYRLRRFGIVYIKNRGFDTEGLISDFFLPENKNVFESHFGRYEDLMIAAENTTNKNTDQLGYTNDAINLHTDQPFIEHPPGFQALQCIKRATSGGDSIFVDGKAASLYLQQEDPMSFDVISTTNVCFHRKQKTFESIIHSPIIKLENGQFQQIRYSYFTMDPMVIPFHQMERWYRSYNNFARIVRNPKHQYHISLNEGDVVLYSNYRMLHGRTGFTGGRHLRGIYFNYQDVWHKLEGM